MIRDILTVLFLAGGIFFFYVGTIGLIRFPDTFTRAHAAAKCDTLGAALSLFALVIYDGISFSSVKLIVTIMFLWITNPTATHLIAKAILKKKQKKEKKEGLEL